MEVNHSYLRTAATPPGLSKTHPVPHDLSALHPVFQSLALNPRIVYLCTILPDVSPRDSDAVERAFFQGSDFADFRTEAHVRKAREPVNPTIDEDPG